MAERIIRWVASLLKCREIYGEDGTLYLSRYRVLGWMPGSNWRWPVSIYLHNIHRADLDDAEHNHPWNWAVSLILHGAYLETRGGSVRWRVAGQLNKLDANTFHRIEAVQGGVWTLFVVGPKGKSWGFNVPGRGFVPWRERLVERGITPSY